MIKNKEKVIRKIAKKILIRYSLEPPVDLSQIIDGEGFHYEESEIQGDGYSILNDKRIVINSDNPYIPRKRFTIAHELGHCIIPWHDDVTMCQIDDYYTAKNRLDIQEKEANVFASELLMPADWMKDNIEDMEGLEIDKLIFSISGKANTSFMATMYALEYSLPSGHVFFVNNTMTGHCSLFVTKDTLTAKMFSIDYEEKCKLFACNYESFSVGKTYRVEHYEMLECPSKDDIIELYESNKCNIVETLSQLTDNNILYIYHCINKILSYIEDKYFFALYNSEKAISIIKSEGSVVSIPYCVSYPELISLCKDKYPRHVMLDLEDDIKLVIIKEDIFVEACTNINTEYDSNQLLKLILNDVYSEDEAKRMSYSINGIIGSANGNNKGATRDELYNIFRHKFLQRGYEEFIEHPKYEEFLSLRLTQILNRKRNK